MQIARVVIVRVIVDGVLGVTVDVHIGHDEVIVISLAIFILFTIDILQILEHSVSRSMR